MAGMQPRDPLTGRFLPQPRDWPSEITEPVRPPSVAADVLVPVCQSLAYALAVLVGGLVACGVFEWPAWYALAAAGITFALAVPGRMHGVGDTLWRTASPVVPDPPAPQPAQVRIELTEQTPGGGVQRMRILDLPIDDQRLAVFARAALEGQSLALAKWTGAGRPFRRGEYVELCDRLEQAGWLIPARGNVGARLTAAGRSMLRKLID